ncbi:MAG TPA: chromosome segregation protein SMC [Clostridiaceae bacterium]
MFLKSLEIKGFKSFADKTEIQFKKGITAIVGPNGSGKSNVSDAVRWVLGEQSIKSLRGGKMEDVIFSGTQFRKPVGLAQVSITLDNSTSWLPVDYNDVTISRRLYRSGDSEYLINNVQCRLKDVQELFMDTGIGKEGYSIIGQGKIEAILSGKPEDKRNLLEEAAGIVKYRSRKEEAERRLQHTEDNVTRLRDIISTYEERLEPLRIDSEKADKFILVAKELEGKEISLIVNSIDKLSKRLNEIGSESSSSKIIIDKLCKDRETIKINIHELEEELEKVENKISLDKQDNFDKKTEYQEIQNKINLSKEKLENSESLYKLYENNRLDIEKRLGEVNADLEKHMMLQERNLLKQQGIEESIKGNTEDTNKISSSHFEERRLMKNLQEDQFDIDNQIIKFKNDTLLIKNDSLTINNRIEEISFSCESYNNSMSVNNSSKNIILKEVQVINTKVNSLEESIRLKRQNIEHSNLKLRGLDDELKKETGTLHKLEANHSMLKNMDMQFEGYNRAVKLLIKDVENNKLKLKGKYYILGQIISINKDLETAIEIALGGAISDIITDDDDIAKVMIEYLKKNNLGRATFLPLNTVKGNKLNDIKECSQIPGYIGIASELIEYDKKFLGPINFLLGRTLIVKDMATGLAIAKKVGFRFKIISLAGEVINVGGSLTGGSNNYKTTSIIGRKREISELEEKIISLKLELDKLAAKIQLFNSKLKELENSCNEEGEKIHRYAIENTKLNGKISAMDSDSEKLKQNLKIATDELSILQDNLDRKSEEMVDTDTLISDLINKKEDFSIKVLQIEKKIEDKDSIIKNLSESILALKIEKASMDEIVLGTQKDLDRFEIDRGSLSLSKLKTNETILGERNKKEEYLLEIGEYNKSLEKLQGKINKFELDFQGKEIERLAHKEDIKKLSSTLEEDIIILSKKEDEFHRLELQLAKFDTEKDGLLQRLNEEFKITYAEGLNFKTKIENIEVHKKEISELKSSITALGTVNLGSIEEYKSTLEKYNFLSEQQLDLTTAKDQLMSVIKELNNKMKMVFNENFLKLKEYFNETFKELFKGGSADLICEGDLLTSSIDINVEPPGKKLQNINLLSGGEKVLSAIALLFAILKMKPTPFCILDEIEAALDDANVYRYSEFLRRFTNKVQFIVITHRKGTMESCNVLYGVTMEEKGVSKIVSVDFKNL